MVVRDLMVFICATRKMELPLAETGMTSGGAGVYFGHTEFDIPISQGEMLSWPLAI